MKQKIIVSACLLGYKCNYKGCCDNKYISNNFFWDNLFNLFEVLPVCPEQLGGMSTPRIPSEIIGNAEKVFSGETYVVAKTGENVTEQFLKGAREVLRIANVFKPDYVVLKSKSPSCGCVSVYDGTFCGKLINGKGITAYLLSKNNFNVIDEEVFLKKFSH